MSREIVEETFFLGHEVVDLDRLSLMREVVGTDLCRPHESLPESHMLPTPISTLSDLELISEDMELSNDHCIIELTDMMRLS